MDTFFLLATTLFVLLACGCLLLFATHSLKISKLNDILHSEIMNLLKDLKKSNDASRRLQSAEIIDRKDIKDSLEYIINKMKENEYTCNYTKPNQLGRHKSKDKGA